MGRFFYANNKEFLYGSFLFQYLSIGIELDHTYCGIAKERILHIDEKHE